MHRKRGLQNHFTPVSRVVGRTTDAQGARLPKSVRLGFERLYIDDIGTLLSSRLFTQVVSATLSVVLIVPVVVVNVV